MCLIWHGCDQLSSGTFFSKHFSLYFVRRPYFFEFISIYMPFYCIWIYNYFIDCILAKCSPRDDDSITQNLHSYLCIFSFLFHFFQKENEFNLFISFFGFCLSFQFLIINNRSIQNKKIDKCEEFLEKNNITESAYILSSSEDADSIESNPFLSLFFLPYYSGLCPPLDFLGDLPVP